MSGAPHGVHIRPEADCASLSSTGTVYYADSSCQTCRVTLLRNRRVVPLRSPSHAHSADELIYVLDGDVQIGVDFLNYRTDVSFYTGGPDDVPLLETVDEMRAAGL
jgi:hypothetical protein